MYQSTQGMTIRIAFSVLFGKYHQSPGLMARMHPLCSRNNSKWPTPGTEPWQTGNTIHSPTSCRTPHMQEPHGTSHSIVIIGGQLRRRHQYDPTSNTRTMLLHCPIHFLQDPATPFQLADSQYSNNNEILVSAV